MSKNIGRMPVLIDPMKISMYDEETETLRLCAPLTPSQNILDSWRSRRRYDLIKKFRDDTTMHLRMQTIVALGTGYNRPWADFAELKIVRCTDTNKRLDIGNIIGGAKITIDALQVKFGGGKNWYTGAGLIIDDSDDHLDIVSVKNKIKKDWGKLDVGTWLFLKRVR